MAKHHYRFNPHTLSFDLIATTLRHKLLRGVGYLVAGFIIATSFSLVFSYFFDTPRTLSLKRDRADVLVKYDLLEKRFDDAKKVLADMAQRDNNIYRSIFEADTIPSSIREAGFGGVDRYGSFSNLKHGKVIIKASLDLDEITRQAFIQSKSFDDVIKMAKQKELMAENMPVIEPLSQRSNVRITAPFGFRQDPFKASIEFHEGVDLAAPEGTAVYASGNGVVELTNSSDHGYGNQIIIDHGFGYKTRYAHLKLIKVKIGQHVKRGEEIALLGNTGRSTGPHLHYEVIYHNKPVNPLNYFGDIDQAEFDKIVDRADLTSGVGQD